MAATTILFFVLTCGGVIEMHGFQIGESKSSHAEEGEHAHASGWQTPVSAGGSFSTQWVGKTNDQRIDGLLKGIKWAGSTISYSDPDKRWDYQTNHPENFTNLSQLTDTQMRAVHATLDSDTFTQPAAHAGFSVEGFTNLTVNYAGHGSGNGTIRLANTSDPSTAYAYYPSTGVWGGDVFFGPSGDYPYAGNYDYHAVIHEIGHALGLKHGHETTPNGSLPYNTDSMEYSVMTYRSHVGHNPAYYKNEYGGYAQTFMMYDIAALQHMYGADYTTSSGDTVYSWKPNSGNTVVDGATAISAADNRIFMTVWDGGGNDTYDLSAYNTSVDIDLRAGAHSEFSSAQLAYLGGGPNNGHARGNVFNALLHDGDQRSLIENAVGGGGHDTIYGNEVDNALSGGGGRDALFGLSGNDTLDGGGGNDTMDGGGGSDTVLYDSNTSSVKVDLTAGKATFPGNNWAAETLVSIENAVTGSGNDVLIGNRSGNSFSGGAGNDTFDGRGGTDSFDGGAGSDTVLYSANTSSVRVDLTAGLVTFPGKPWQGEEVVSIENAVTGSGADTLIGNASANTLRGGAGNDVIQGNGGRDVMVGGSGNDVFRFVDASDSRPWAADVIRGGDGASAFQRAGNGFGDRIDLSAFDADTTRNGIQDFEFGNATGKGRLWAIDSGKNTLICGNTDGDRAIEFQCIIRDGNVRASSYTEADFIF